MPYGSTPTRWSRSNGLSAVADSNNPDRPRLRLPSLFACVPGASRSNSCASGVTSRRPGNLRGLIITRPTHADPPWHSVPLLDSPVALILTYPTSSYRSALAADWMIQIHLLRIGGMRTHFRASPRQILCAIFQHWLCPSTDLGGHLLVHAIGNEREFATARRCADIAIISHSLVMRNAVGAKSRLSAPMLSIEMSEAKVVILRIKSLYKSLVVSSSNQG